MMAEEKKEGALSQMARAGAGIWGSALAGNLIDGPLLLAWMAQNAPKNVLNLLSNLPMTEGQSDPPELWAPKVRKRFGMPEHPENVADTLIQLAADMSGAAVGMARPKLSKAASYRAQPPEPPRHLTRGTTAPRVLQYEPGTYIHGTPAKTLATDLEGGIPFGRGEGGEVGYVSRYDRPGGYSKSLTARGGFGPETEFTRGEPEIGLGRERFDARNAYKLDVPALLPDEAEFLAERHDPYTTLKGMGYDPMKEAVPHDVVRKAAKKAATPLHPQIALELEHRRTLPQLSKNYQPSELVITPELQSEIASPDQIRAVISDRPLTELIAAMRQSGTTRPIYHPDGSLRLDPQLSEPPPLPPPRERGLARTIIEMFQRDLGNQRGSIGGGKKPPGEPMGYDRYKKRFGNEPVEVPEDPEGLRMYLDRMLKRADRPLPHLQQMLDNWEDTKSYQPYLDRLKQYRDEEALEGRWPPKGPEIPDSQLRLNYTEDWLKGKAVRPEDQPFERWLTEEPFRGRYANPDVWKHITPDYIKVLEDEWARDTGNTPPGHDVIYLGPGKEPKGKVASLDQRRTGKNLAKWKPIHPDERPFLDEAIKDEPPPGAPPWTQEERDAWLANDWTTLDPGEGWTTWEGYLPEPTKPGQRRSKWTFGGEPTSGPIREFLKRMFSIVNNEKGAIGFNLSPTEADRRIYPLFKRGLEETADIVDPTTNPVGQMLLDREGKLYLANRVGGHDELVNRAIAASGLRNNEDFRRDYKYQGPTWLAHELGLGRLVQYPFNLSTSWGKQPTGKQLSTLEPMAYGPEFRWDLMDSPENLLAHGGGWKNFDRALEQLAKQYRDLQIRGGR